MGSGVHVEVKLPVISVMIFSIVLKSVIEIFTFLACYICFRFLNLSYLVGDVQSAEIGTDIKNVFVISLPLFEESEGSWCWGISGSWGSQSVGTKSYRFSTLWARAVCVGFLDGDWNLALVEQLRAISVFVNVGFLQKIQSGYWIALETFTLKLINFFRL